MVVPTETITAENVVASTAVDQDLNLDVLRVDLSQADYDPDRFPGLIYRTNDPRAASLVFRLGKVVTTGARSEPDAHGALEILFGELDGLMVTVSDTPTVTVQNTVSTADLDVR